MNDKKMVWGISVVLLALGFLVFNRSSCAQQKNDAKIQQSETAALKEEIAKLNGRIATLEAQLAGQPAGVGAAVPGTAPVTDDEWDPFAQMNAMNQMMAGMMPAMMGPMMSMDTFNPRIDIKEDGSHYVISMDIPGMDKDKIDVKVENQNLIVSGERSTETQEKAQSGKVYRHERSFGHFMRVVPLPKDARTDDVDAAYANGVLTIKVGRLVKDNKPAGQKITVK